MHMLKAHFGCGWQVGQSGGCSNHLGKSWWGLKLGWQE